MSGLIGGENARTRGDGMENSEIQSNEIQPTVVHSSVLGSIGNSRPALPIPGQNLIYRATDATNNSQPPIKPKGKIFNLVPRLIVSNKQFSLKTKEPRFIPFEPYKGAVNPIIPLKHPKKSRNRNNLDLNTLVAHMSDMKAIDLNRKASDDTIGSIITPKEFDELKKERDSLAMQLKSQVQVNAELKNLLVAAVGEDLQTRVNVLTEDKLQLARALLSSAKNLSSHTEQIEYLAGQSEVWRSKFLASSLMVEELARWKASLMHKNKKLLDSNKQMLETMSTLREIGAETLGYMKIFSANQNTKSSIKQCVRCFR